MNSNTKKIIILVVIILILSALMSAICGISTLGIRLFKSSRSSSAETWTPKGNFSDIDIDTEVSDIRIYPADNDSVKVTWTGNSATKVSVNVRNGTLTIEEKANRRLFGLINLSGSSSVISVYLPKGAYDSIDIESDTGSISGQSLSVKKLELKSDTGSVEFSDIKASQEVKVKNAVGKITLTNVTCRKLDAENNTGSIHLTNVTAEGSLKAESDVGSIHLDRCDAGSLDLKTDIGSITGSLRSEKIFITKTDLGSISVPNTTSGGTCKAETSTGRIELTIAGR